MRAGSDDRCFSDIDDDHLLEAISTYLPYHSVRYCVRVGEALTRSTYTAPEFI